MSNSEIQSRHMAEAAEIVQVVLEAVVRCTEIDVNGHLNNGKYVEYLEWGREEWYDRHGFAYDRLKELGAITVVVNVNLNYRQPCHQGDQLRIRTWPRGRGRTSFTLAQRIDKADGTAAADAVVTLVTVDPDTRRALPLPEEFARLFSPGDETHFLRGTVKTWRPTTGLTRR
jgi:YbgC/YbaW family acyl-CoA thioester hydrolase